MPSNESIEYKKVNVSKKKICTFHHVSIYIFHVFFFFFVNQKLVNLIIR